MIQSDDEIRIKIVGTRVDAKDIVSTQQPLYNMVRYNTVLYITDVQDGSQKCIDYIEK